MAPRLILVDDDSNVRSSVARLMRRFGFDVVACADASEAIAAIRAARAAVVLSDFDLGPGPNGMVVLEEARDADDSTLRVLFTASIDAAIDAARESGIAHRVLTKPMSIADLEALYAAVARPD